jgi:hypothetical protein
MYDFVGESKILGWYKWYQKKISKTNSSYEIIIFRGYLNVEGEFWSPKRKHCY